jgi:ribosomal protein S18 acetylase RimI-like enzyme
MIRKAEERDASSLAAVSIEVWVNTYLRDGVSPMGGESAWLTVEAENRRAIDFYLRHGFTRIGSTDFAIADRAYENHVMRTDLRQPPADQQ